MSAAASSCGWCSPVVDGPALELEDEGSAVRIDGSNSRILSSVRGTFSARRFFFLFNSKEKSTHREIIMNRMGTHFLQCWICSFQLRLLKSFLKLLLAFGFFSLSGYFFPLYLVLDTGRCKSRTPRHSGTKSRTVLYDVRKQNCMFSPRARNITTYFFPPCFANNDCDDKLCLGGDHHCLPYGSS